MDTVISCAHGLAHGIRANGWWEGRLPNMSTSIFPPFRYPPVMGRVTQKSGSASSATGPSAVRHWAGTPGPRRYPQGASNNDGAASPPPPPPPGSAAAHRTFLGVGPVTPEAAGVRASWRSGDKRAARNRGGLHGPAPDRLAAAWLGARPAPGGWRADGQAARLRNDWRGVVALFLNEEPCFHRFDASEAGHTIVARVAWTWSLSDLVRDSSPPGHCPTLTYLCSRMTYTQTVRETTSRDQGSELSHATMTPQMTVVADLTRREE